MPAAGARARPASALDALAGGGGGGPCGPASPAQVAARACVILAAVGLLTTALARGTDGGGAAPPAGYERWDYSAPLCAPNGTCAEAPDAPTPKTRFSAKSAEQMRAWHATRALMARRAASGAAEARLVLYGDSITESLLGTAFGAPAERAAGSAEVLAAELGGEWAHPLPLAIAGDQTQHLLWRLEHGELPRALRSSRAPLVVHIGTNNLGAGHLPAEAARGIVAVAGALLERTASRVLVLALLPRGDGHRLGQLCPPRCAAPGTPFASFLPAVRRVNALLRAAVAELGARHPGRVALADCGAPFEGADARTPPTAVAPPRAGAAGSSKRAAPARGGVERALMPDLLHPNAEGQRVLLRCVAKHLRALEAGGGAPP